MTTLAIILAAAIGYFAGAIPFGKLYVRLFTGQDLQKIGSGRTGGTNSMRAAGFWVGLLVALSDVAKGAVGLLLARFLLGGLVSPDMVGWVEVAAGIFSVIGHNWSIFIGFRGGAGTGPNVGWATAIWWPMFPIAFAFMLVMILVVGYASVGSMGMGLIIPAMFLWLYLNGMISGTVAYIVGGVITALIVAFSLRQNFARLARGEERLVGIRARWRRQREEAEAKKMNKNNGKSKLKLRPDETAS